VGLVRKRAQQIGTTHNSNHVAVSNDRNTLYPIICKKPRNFADIRVRSYAYDRAGHDGAGRLVGGAEIRNEVGIECFAFRQERQPPITPCLPLRLGPRDEIAFADHADWRSILINDGNGADAILEKDLGDVLDRNIRAYRYDVGGHHIGSFHGAMSLAVQLGMVCEPR